MTMPVRPVSSELVQLFEESSNRVGPAIPPDLSMEFTRRGQPNPVMVIRDTRKPLSEAACKEATAIATQLERDLLPFQTTEEHRKAALDLLDAINCCVRRPLSTEDLEIRLHFVMVATAHFPAKAWSERVLRKALMMFSYFPAVADVVNLLDDQLASLREEIATYRVAVIRSQRMKSR